MKTAIFQSGASILGIGEDLYSAVRDANQFLDADSQVDEQSIGVVCGGETDGEIYFAGITDSLVAQVESGDAENYTRTPANILDVE